MAHDILIYSDIGGYYDGMTGKLFSEELGKVSKTEETVDLRINSMGGSVADGLAIYNLANKFKAQQRAFNDKFRLRTIVDGYAYSAGSLIAMAGDEIIMNQGTMMMVHCAWTIVLGNATELMSSAEYMKKLDGNLAAIYMKVTGKDQNKVMALLEAETYMTPEEAVNAKFATRIDENVVANYSLYPEATGAFKATHPGDYAKFMRSRLDDKAKAKGTTADALARLALQEMMFNGYGDAA